MGLEPIEVMDDMDEFNKLMKSYFDDMTKQVMQGFELVANQLRGKLEAGGGSSSHHGETHKTIIFEEFDDWLYLFWHTTTYMNSLRRRLRSHQVLWVVT